MIPCCCSQIWRQLFSPLHALNFGVGGDATQHVLWRLSNGELDNISPKVLIMIEYMNQNRVRVVRVWDDRAIHTRRHHPQDSNVNSVLIVLILQVVVLWVGTNNHGHDPKQICSGILAIVQVIKNKLPNARTLVLVGFCSSVLPVGLTWRSLVCT